VIDARRIEEVGLNALQTQRQLFYDGWLLRVSPGKAKRARSVNAHFGSTLAAGREDRALRAHLRRARAADAVPHHAVLRAADLERALEARGYAPFDPTLVQAVELDGTALPVPGRTSFELVDASVDAFVDAVAALRGSPGAAARRAPRALNHSPLDGRHVLALADGVPVAAGKTAREGDVVGVFDVVTDEALRGQGIATALVARSWRARGTAARAWPTSGRRRPTRRRSRCTAASASRRSTPTITSAARANAASARRRRDPRRRAGAGRCAARARLDARDRRVVHRRRHRARDHRDPGQLGRARPRLRHLLERREDEMLGVDTAAIGGTAPCPRRSQLAMADGALRASRADVAVAVHGNRGPGGGTAQRPVGTVCFAWATLEGERQARTVRLDGDRRGDSGPVGGDRPGRAAALAGVASAVDLVHRTPFHRTIVLWNNARH
jgi:GNAT superfamily N-acetyltransferase